MYSYSRTGGHRGHEGMVDGFTTACAISDFRKNGKIFFRNIFIKPFILQDFRICQLKRIKIHRDSGNDTLFHCVRPCEISTLVRTTR
jgi:hypothetical protein